MDSLIKRVGDLETRLTLEALEADGVNHTHNGTYIDDLEARLERVECISHAPRSIPSDDGICRIVDRHFRDRRKARFKSFVFWLGISTLVGLGIGAYVLILYGINALCCSG